MNKTKFRNDGAVLRYIAVVAMFIDHLALCMYDFIPMGLYLAGRAIGRISYPIFAYCLAAGFRYTHDIKRYAGRIAIAAVISEIPFNLMVGRSICFPQAQNVMWTLLIGLAMLWGVGQVRPQVSTPSTPANASDETQEQPGEQSGNPSDEMTGTREQIGRQPGEQAYEMTGTREQTGRQPGEQMYRLTAMRRQAREQARWLLMGLGKIIIIALACGLATLLHTDYEWEGILVIAAFSFMPAGMYDIPRGSYPRYLFYAFYPAHMLLLVLLRAALGLM